MTSSNVSTGHQERISTAIGEVDVAVTKAADSADEFAASTAQQRSQLLRGLADALEARRHQLVATADTESKLGAARLNGELDRTTFQLRGFADLLDSGQVHAVVEDKAVDGPPPAGHPEIRRMRVPLGPVAMFAASNFPFAFSVLGGDTASALAAGCPVVVKAHPAHPELSRQTAALAAEVIEASGLPRGVFQFVQGDAIELGVRLVEASAISAVAFTGSFKGGIALSKIAAARQRPIPFYGELGSVNPVIALPPALEGGSEALAKSLAASICQGAGQFCTSPGVIVVPRGAAGDAFVKFLVSGLENLSPHAMLSDSIRDNFDRGLERWKQSPKLVPLLNGSSTAGDTPKPFLVEVDAADFIGDTTLVEEVFGPAAIVVRVSSEQETLGILKAIGGSLTVTLWGADEETDFVRRLVRTAAQVAGRVLFKGVPTGVAVSAAQHHGGPFPASTLPSSTSVGYAAIDRFLRPVAFQDVPKWLRDRNGRPC